MMTVFLSCSQWISCLLLQIWKGENKMSYLMLKLSTLYIALFFPGRILCVSLVTRNLLLRVYRICFLANTNAEWKKWQNMFFTSIITIIYLTNMKFKEFCSPNRNYRRREKRGEKSINRWISHHSQDNNMLSSRLMQFFPMIYLLK